MISLDLEAGSDPLKAWVWDSAVDDYVRTETALPPEASEIVGDHVEQITPAEFERLFPEASFRENVAAVLRVGGSLARLESMAVNESDAAFVRAAEVAYRRLFTGPNAHLLKYFTNRDIVDCVIVGAFVVPYAKSIVSEIKAKKGAAAVPSPQRTEGETDGDE
jgi:hypothetical protein